MPLLKHVRFVGIKLDEGKKVIPDITWSPNKKNMLFLLENGGGKTSYIQLLMQTILPNSSMNKRDLKTTLAKKSYGHIVTTWRLDGDSPKYLCTGFCFKNAETDKDTIAYYTYMFSYNDDSELSIRTLPLKQGNKVTKYQELKTLLNKYEYPIVTVFDTVSAYKNALRLRGILPEEWESIAKINGDEGGAAGFFTKANTTKSLIERLLIPTIEDTIFQTKEGKDEILRSYKSYKDNLIKIPEMKKDLFDFRVIEEKSEDVVKAVEGYTKVKDELQQETVTFQRVNQTIEELKEEYTEKLQSYDTDLGGLNSEVKNLDWKIASYEVHQAEEELELQKRQLGNQESEQDRIKQLYESLVDKEKEMKAMQQYIKYASSVREMKNKKIQIELLEKSEPELKKTVEETKSLLQNAWSSVLEQKEVKVVEKERRLVFLREEKKRKLDEIKVVEGKISDLKENRSKVEFAISSYEKEFAELEGKIGKEEMLYPIDTLSSLQAKLDKNEEMVEQLRQSLTDMKAELQLIHDEECNLIDEKNACQSEMNEATSGINHYKTQEVNVRLALAPFQKDKRDLHVEKAQILSFLEREMLTLDNKKNDLIVNISELKKALNRLESHDFFVPHDMLIEVKTFLEDNGLFVLLGSEWLSEQQIPDEDKERYLSKYPLLPYSILIEEPQVTLLKKALEKYKGVISEIPFIFQLKNQMDLNGNTENAQIYALNEKGTYTAQTLDVSLFTSKTETERLIDELKGNIEVKTKSLDDVQYELNRYEKALRLSRQFYIDFTDTYLSALEKKVVSINKSIGEIDTKISRIRSRKNEIGIEEKEMDERISHIELNNKDITPKIHSLSSFVERYQNPDELYASLKTLNLEIEGQTGIKEVMKDEVISTEAKIEKQVIELRDESNNKNAFITEGSKLGLDELHEPDDHYTSDDYVEYKLTYENAEKHLSGKMQEIDSLKEIHELHRKSASEAEKEIENLEQSLVYIEQNFYNVHEADMQEIKKEKEVVNKHLKDCGGKCQELRTIVASVESKKETLVGTLIKEYADISETPFVYSDNSTKQYEGFVYTKQQIQEQIELLIQNIGNVKFALSDIESAITLAEDVYIPPAKEILSFSMDELKLLGETFVDVVKKIKGRYKSVSNKYSSERESVESAFKKYERHLQETNNSKVKKVARDIDDAVIKTGKMFDVDFVLSVFQRFFDAIESMKSHYQTQLKELDRDKENLVHLSYQRAQTMYDNIIEIPKHSKIELYGKQIQIVKIDWSCLPEDLAKANIRIFIDSLLENVLTLKRDGKTDDEIDAFMRNQLSIIKLISNLANIEDCKIKIFKPRKRTMVESRNGVEYFPWDSAAGWSGGEGYTSYMAMFMIIITHIRKKTTAKENWKVIIADNPFGKASSEHVVKPIIELAAKNKIQLFCLTALKEEGIRAHFDVISSNRYYNHGGVEFLATQHKQGLQDGLLLEEMGKLTVDFS